LEIQLTALLPPKAPILFPSGLGKAVVLQLRRAPFGRPDRGQAKNGNN